jgi:hypothetical protein
LFGLGFKPETETCGLITKRWPCSSVVPNVFLFVCVGERVRGGGVETFDSKHRVQAKQETFGRK